jgi:N4-(beta-N-acetylglucosaminyl)-L-asparaginase
MATGAVGALRFIKSAVRAAAMVKDHTQHSILVGDQATAFAVSMGLQFSSLTTQASAELHRSWEQARCQPNFRAGVVPDATKSCGPYSRVPDPHAILSVPQQDTSHPQSTQSVALEPDRGTPTLISHSPPSWQIAHDGMRSGLPLRSETSSTDHEELQQADARPGRRCGIGWPGPGAHDTIAILATDTLGNMAAATSTNGNCGKVPGRVGDAAIPGAGAYAVTHVGACGATGDGDIMMRFLPCYRVPCPAACKCLFCIVLCFCLALSTKAMQ